jgi:GDP-L-fucose synthase
MKTSWDITGKTVLILGAQGLVGSALVRRLDQEDCNVIAATRAQADLTDAKQTADYIQSINPDAIFLSAAKVGGILANRDYPVDFLEANLLIQLNVLRAAHDENVERVVFLGSSCIYPKFAKQPISEKSLMTGALEPTNDAYAIAKIAGIRLIDAFRQQYGRRWVSAMPTNLYGPNDNFELNTSHVLPALLRRFHEAKVANLPTVEIWGTGRVRREFLHVDDCADALTHILKAYDDSGPINVGFGSDISINELAEMIKTMTGFKGVLTHDLTKPDGTPAKLMDSSRLFQLGWKPQVNLSDGLQQVYQWFLDHH